MSAEKLDEWNELCDCKMCKKITNHKCNHKYFQLDRMSAIESISAEKTCELCLTKTKEM